MPDFCLPSFHQLLFKQKVQGSDLWLMAIAAMLCQPSHGCWSSLYSSSASGCLVPPQPLPRSTFVSMSGFWCDLGVIKDKLSPETPLVSISGTGHASSNPSLLCGAVAYILQPVIFLFFQQLELRATKAPSSAVATHCLSASTCPLPT